MNGKAIGRFFVILAVASALFVGCGEGAPKPRAIVSGEECAYCRMAIDRLQYAAQLIERNGEYRVFDHPVCMIRYMADAERAHPGYEAGIRAYYVADVRTGKWLPAQDARYIVHPKIPTVMDYGVVATDSASASAVAAPFGARILSFDELKRESSPGK